MSATWIHGRGRKGALMESTQLCPILKVSPDANNIYDQFSLSSKSHKRPMRPERLGALRKAMYTQTGSSICSKAKGAPGGHRTVCFLSKVTQRTFAPATQQEKVFVSLGNRGTPLLCPRLLVALGLNYRQENKLLFFFKLQHFQGAFLNSTPQHQRHTEWLQEF